MVVRNGPAVNYAGGPHDPFPEEPRRFRVYVRAHQQPALVTDAECFEDAERVEVVPPVDDLTILDGDD
jgi:type II secretory pathway predicted ATPase ExeA